MSTDLRPHLCRGDVVILIHGTFADDATWINQDGRVAKAIHAAMPGVAFEAFRWSGNNTHSARLTAAEALARRIDTLASSLEDRAGIHLIGHSHGGNVALYARDRTRRPGRIHSIALLGTPFLKLYPLGNEENWATWTSLAEYGVPLVIFVAVTPIVVGVLFATGVFETDWMPWSIFLGAAIVSQLTSWIAKKLRDWRDSTGAKMVDQTAHNQQRRLAQSPPTQPVLVAFTAGDEARHWLKFGGRASRLPTRMFHRTSEFMGAALGGALLAVMAVGLLQHVFDGLSIDRLKTDPVLSAGFYWLMMLAIAAVFVVPAAAFVASFALRGNPWIFGWEHPLVSLRLAMTASAIPAWADQPNCLLYRMNARPSLLRHSGFYSDPATVTAIATWLTGQEIAAETPFAAQPPHAPTPVVWKWTCRCASIVAFVFIWQVALHGSTSIMATPALLKHWVTRFSPYATPDPARPPTIAPAAVPATAPPRWPEDRTK